MADPLNELIKKLGLKDNYIIILDMKNNNYTIIKDAFSPNASKLTTEFLGTDTLKVKIIRIKIKDKSPITHYEKL